MKLLHQVQSEWIKLRTVRSTNIMFFCALFLAAFFGAIVQIASDGDQPIENLMYGLLISQVLFAVIGVQIIGQEYRFKTIRTTFANNPNRIQVIFAKLIVLVLAVALSAVLLIMVSILFGYFVLAVQGYTIDFSAPGTTRFLIGVFAVCIFTSILGFAIGLILRQPIAGIIVVILWMLVVENIIVGILLVFDIHAVKWFPFISLLSTAAMEPDPETFSQPIAILYSGSIFLALVAVGAFLIRSRDA